MVNNIKLAGFFVAVLVSASLLCHASEETSLKEEIKKTEELLIQEGKYSEAKEKIQMLLEAHPDNERLRVGMALAEYGLMRYGDSYESFKKADTTWADPGTRKLIRYGIRSIENNRDVLAGIEDANAKLSRSTGPAREELVKDMVVWHFVVINDLLNQQYYYAAMVMPHILWIQENDPDTAELSSFAAGVFHSSMMYKKAKEEYEKAIEIAPENPKLARCFADCLVAMGDLDGAKDQYQKTVEIYVRQGAGKNDPGILEAKRIMNALPRKYDDIEELVSKKQYIQAEEICRKRISLNPGDLAAITQLGDIYWNTDRKRQAIKLFRKVIKRVPDYPTAHLYLGRAYFSEGKPEKGSRCFDLFEEKMAILPETDEKTDEFHINALHYMASLYLEAGMVREAVRNYKKIIEIDPEDQEAYYNLGVTYYHEIHNRAKAYKYLKQARELGPSTAIGDMASIAIEHMQRVPDTRFVGTPRVSAHQGQMNRIVRNQMMTGGIKRMKEKKKDITEEDMAK